MPKRHIDKRRTGRLLSLFLTLALVLGLSVTVYASDPLTNYMPDWPQMTDITPESACLMDAENGAILYSLNRDDKHYPASITKILTCLLTIENCQMSDVVTMGEEALSVAIDGNSNINPVLGEQFTVEQCLYMLMLKSANDVAVQLAIQVAGSVSAFSDMMNARAAAIGCTGTHFNNPNGLPDENHYTTANDMALIMRECLQNETFRQIIATEYYVVGPTNMKDESREFTNHNCLILPDNDAYYPDCIGGKTGYTDAAERTLVAAAERDGRTLICVTMFCPDSSDFYDMQSLFEYGFNNFTLHTVDENDGATATTGSYTMPNGVEDHLSTAEMGTTEDGRTYINYMYNDKIRVGEGFVTTLATPEPTEEPTPSPTETVTEKPTKAPAKETQEENASAGTDASPTASPAQRSLADSLASLSTKGIAALLGAALCLVIIIVTGILLIVDARREKERQRRAAEKRRKRMAELKKARENADGPEE